MIYIDNIYEPMARTIKKLSIEILFAITLSPALVSSLRAEIAMAQLSNFNLNGIKDSQGLILFKAEKGDKGDKRKQEIPGKDEAQGPQGEKAEKADNEAPGASSP